MEEKTYDEEWSQKLSLKENDEEHVNFICYIRVQKKKELFLILREQLVHDDISRIVWFFLHTRLYLDHQDEEADMALHFACSAKKPHIRLIQTLLDAKQNKASFYTFLYACGNVNLHLRNLNFTPEILGQEINLEAENKQALEFLEDVPNVDYNLQTKTNGYSALMLAIQKNINLSAIEILIKNKNINVKLQDHEGRTALIWGVLNDDLQILKCLLKHSHEQVINVKDKFGKTALMYVCERGNLRILKCLLAVKKIDVNIQDNGGKTCIYWATIRGESKILDKLINTNPHVDVNMCDNLNLSPLIYAARHGQIECIESLLRADISVNYEAIPGISALSVAAVHANLEVIKCLLTVFDIDVNIKNEEKLTALSHAVKTSNHKLVQLLLTARQIDVNIPNTNGYTPLLEAVRDNKHKIVEYLLCSHRQIDLNICEPKNQFSSLMFSIQNCTPWLTESLLASASHLDINLPDSLGNSPLLSACAKGNVPIVQRLLRHKDIDINKQNKEGMTAIMICAEKNFVAIGRILMGEKFKANIDLKNIKNLSVFDIAEKGKHYNFLELLYTDTSCHIL